MIATIVAWSPTLDWTGTGTLALALVTAMLALATAREARLGRDELKAAQRPVVVPEEMFVTTGGEWLVVRLRNIGPGAAVNVSAFVVREVVGRRRFLDSKPPLTLAALGGDDEVKFKAERVRSVLSDHPWDALCLLVLCEDVAAGVWWTAAWSFPPVTEVDLEELVSHGWRAKQMGEGDGPKTLSEPERRLGSVERTSWIREPSRRR